MINAVDASYILSYYAYTATGGTIGFREYLNNQNINNPPQTTTTILQTTKATTTTTTSVVNSTTTTKITPPVTTTTNINSFKVSVYGQNSSNGIYTKYYSDNNTNRLNGSTMKINGKDISVVYNENKTQAEIRITAEMIYQVDNCPGYIGYKITNKDNAIIEKDNIKCDHISVGEKVLKTLTIKGTPGETYHVQFYDRFTF